MQKPQRMTRSDSEGEQRFPEEEPRRRSTAVLWALFRAGSCRWVVAGQVRPFVLVFCPRRLRPKLTATLWLCQYVTGFVILPALNSVRCNRSSWSALVRLRLQGN